MVWWPLAPWSAAGTTGQLIDFFNLNLRLLQFRLRLLLDLLMATVATLFYSRNGIVDGRSRWTKGRVSEENQLARRAFSIDFNHSRISPLGMRSIVKNKIHVENDEIERDRLASKTNQLSGTRRPRASVLAKQSAVKASRVSVITIATPDLDVASSQGRHGRSPVKDKTK